MNLIISILDLSSVNVITLTVNILLLYILLLYILCYILHVYPFFIGKINLDDILDILLKLQFQILLIKRENTRRYSGEKKMQKADCLQLKFARSALSATCS